MKSGAKQECYYWLDKSSGVTSEAMTWQELEQLVPCGTIALDSPVTQEGADGWCELSALLERGEGTRVSDVLSETQSGRRRGVLSSLLTRIFKKG